MTYDHDEGFVRLPSAGAQWTTRIQKRPRRVHTRSRSQMRASTRNVGLRAGLRLRGKLATVTLVLRQSLRWGSLDAATLSCATTCLLRVTRAGPSARSSPGQTITSIPQPW